MKENVQFKAQVKRKEMTSTDREHWSYHEEKHCLSVRTHSSRISEPPHQCSDLRRAQMTCQGKLWNTVDTLILSFLKMVHWEITEIQLFTKYVTIKERGIIWKPYNTMLVHRTMWEKDILNFTGRTSSLDWVHSVRNLFHCIVWRWSFIHFYLK